MVIPFNLLFFRNNNEGEKFSDFTTSYTEAINNIDKFSYSANELQDLRVLFSSNHSEISTLWIELMDMLPIDCFENEESENKFHASKSIRGLYLNSKSNNNPANKEYPILLPGAYKMIIKVSDVSYYAFLNIKPIRITEKQIDFMREEVEETLLGLSKEVTKKSNNGKDASNEKELLVFHYLNILKRTHREIILNLNLILKNPRFEIAKKYSIKSLDSNMRIDLETIKHKQTRSDLTNKLKGYKYEIDYSISVNRSLKRILFYLKKTAIEVKSYLKEYIIRLEAELKERNIFKRDNGDLLVRISLYEENIKVVDKILQSILSALHSDWMLPIEPSIINRSQISRTSNYNKIYKVFLELERKTSLESDPFKAYMYYWKDTPKLYEIWGFIKIVDILIKSKKEFSSISGWIFNKKAITSEFPFLDSETKIEFENKDGLKICLYYDSLVTKDYRETTIENPLYTIENHNRPDLKMDIYYNGRLKGSLIADFKYRKIDRLGTVGVYIGNNKKAPGYSVYKQLVDYSHMRTFYLNRSKRSRNNEFAVKKVLVLFPIYSHEKVKNIKDPSTNIIRMSLSPLSSYDHLVQEIEETIDIAIEEE